MKSQASFYYNRSMLKNDVGPIIGHLRAQDVTKRDIIRMLDRIAARGDARLKKKPGDVAMRSVCRFSLTPAHFRTGPIACSK